MADEFRAAPAELSRVSNRLRAISSQVKEVMATLRANLAAEGAAWSDDEIGDQFANGPNGYLAQVGWVNGSVDAKTALLDHYADHTKLAADSIEQSDLV